jgi:hypothetical protein
MAVFICYRRDDTEGEARALHARLAEETDERHLFLDHDAIGVGDNWRARIDDALRRVEAAIVIIGPRWLSSVDARAKSGEPDVVRSEIARCLSRPDITVIPVLVKGATMPDAESLPPDVRPVVEGIGSSKLQLVSGCSRSPRPSTGRASRFRAYP